MQRAGIFLCILSISWLTTACSGSVEIEKTLKLTDVHTGWYDAGIVSGKNKLVPSIALRIQNTVQDPVTGVQLNAVFHRVGEQEGWGEHFVRAVGQEGLAGGATGGQLVLRSNLGYTGDEPRLDMMKNNAWVDARVEIFGKQGRRNWVKMGEFRIDRQLLTQ